MEDKNLLGKPSALGSEVYSHPVSQRGKTDNKAKVESVIQLRRVLALLAHR